MEYILVEFEYVLRIIIAGICGAVIGYERKSRLKEAGVRTHFIVALASALMMIVSKYGFSDLSEGTTGIRGADPARIAAAIVSGVGFLGAGAIFVRKQIIQGLDSKHRENILRFWTKDSSRQVILLSQDKEIDAIQYQRLKPSILKSYLLTHRDMGNGIGQTTADEGYFGEEDGHATRYE